MFKFNLSTTTTKKVKNKKIYLPWVEKYRPKKLKDIILNKIIKNKIDNFIKKKEISNMIITGYSGTGKTSTILCLALSIYKKHYKNAIMELNASNDRGLNTINNSIIHFSKKKVDLPDNLYKLIILDEADNITIKAQHNLINLMDKYDNTLKIVFTCNNHSKLIEGIQSRCLILKYNKASNKDIKKRIINICKLENIEYTEKGIDTIVSLCDGDIRKCINFLESTYYGFNKITSENIYKICEKPSLDYIKSILDLCKNKDLNGALEKLDQLKFKGYSNNDILLVFVIVVNTYDVNETKRINILDKINEVIINVNNNMNTNLQLYYCICQIFKIF